MVEAYVIVREDREHERFWDAIRKDWKALRLATLYSRESARIVAKHLAVNKARPVKVGISILE